MDHKEGKKDNHEARSLAEISESNLQARTDSLKNDAMKVSFKSKREFPYAIQPINKTRDRMSFCYGRIKTEELTKKKLKDAFIESNADIDVIEDDDSYILQYKTQPPISINKVDGKFYSYSEGMSQTARIIWEILKKNGYIQDPHRTWVRRKKEISNPKESIWKE